VWRRWANNSHAHMSTWWQDKGPVPQLPPVKHSTTHACTHNTPPRSCPKAPDLTCCAPVSRAISAVALCRSSASTWDISSRRAAWGSTVKGPTRLVSVPAPVLACGIGTCMQEGGAAVAATASACNGGRLPHQQPSLYNSVHKADIHPGRVSICGSATVHGTHLQHVCFDASTKPRPPRPQGCAYVSCTTQCEMHVACCTPAACLL
jgi:hypothetical protein